MDDDDKLSPEDSKIEQAITEISEEPEKKPNVRLRPHSKEKRYTQRYSTSWERNPNFKDWLAPVADDPQHAYCKFCCASLLAKKKSLVDHAKSRKHMKARQKATLDIAPKAFDFSIHPQTFVITILEKLMRGPLFLEGKRKKIFSVIASPALVVIEFKELEAEGYPDLTAYSANTLNNIHCKLFSYLNQSGIRTSFLKAENECAYSSRKCDIIPLEFVVRRIAAGNFCKQNLGVYEGYQFRSLRVEIYLKNSPTEITLMSENQIIDAGWTIGGIVLGRIECNIMQKSAITAFEVLEKGFKSVGCALVELKMHYGIDYETKDIVISDLDVEGNGLHLWNANDKRLHKEKIFNRCESIVQEEVYVPEKVDQLNLESKGLVVVVIDSCDQDVFCDNIRTELEKYGIRSQMRQGSAYYNTESTLNMISEYDDMDIPIVFIATSSKSASLGALISANTVHSVINCPNIDVLDNAQFAAYIATTGAGIGCPAMRVEDAIQYVGKLLAPSDHVVWSKERGKLLANWRKIIDGDRVAMNRVPNSTLEALSVTQT